MQRIIRFISKKLGSSSEPCLQKKKANSVTDWLANYDLIRSCFDRFSISLNDSSVSLHCICIMI